MKALVTLLGNQTIRIDNHRRGEIIDWNDKTASIHLHKYSNKGSHECYDIRIPLNTKQPVEVKRPETGRLPKRIRREISDVLDDEKNRDRFFNGVFSQLQKINWTRDESSEQEIVKRVATAFNLEISSYLVVGEGIVSSVLYTMSSLNTIIYHLIINYSKKCSYIGQKTYGIMRGIHARPRNEWIQRIDAALPSILSKPTTAERRSMLKEIKDGITGIGDATLAEAVAYVEQHFFGGPNKTV